MAASVQVPGRLRSGSRGRRQRPHRFYLREGMHIQAHHFVLPLRPAAAEPLPTPVEQPTSGAGRPGQLTG
jgi:hypothetical protein